MTRDVLDRIRRRVASVLVFLLIGYVGYSIAFGALPNLQHRSIVMILSLGIAFACFPLRASGPGRALGAGVDAVLFAGVVAAAVYVIVNYWDLMLNPGLPGGVAMLLGGALILAVLDLSRRCLGWAFAILVAVFAAYALFGDLLPGKLGHGGASLRMLVSLTYLSTDGLLGGLFGIFATLLIPFVVFSGFMLATGAGEAFLDLAKVAGGRFSGGPAKVSVMSSAFVGSMTGSSVTNVAMTGNFTIPLMKRLGYRPAVAGAIEATASSGGQITPPLMGAGLFLMAELLRVPVPEMMLIALVPAALFYIGVLGSVHFESVRAGVGALPREEVPKLDRFRGFAVWGPLALPFLVLISMIFIGFSVGLALLGAIGTLLAAYLSGARDRRGLADRLAVLGRAMGDMARPIAVLGVLCAAAGLLVAVIGYVGVGVKVADMVLALGTDNLPLTLVLAAAMVMLAGMGMPTTAAYLLAASVIATTFAELGIPDLQAHMFIFYFATLSAITPPVCAAVYVAAGLADAPWFKVALEAVRFAAIKYLLPFLFIAQPALLLSGAPAEIAWTIAVCAVATVALSAALAGQLFRPLGPVERAVLLLGAGLAFWPDPAVALAGLAILAGSALWNRRGRAGARTLAR